MGTLSLLAAQLVLACVLQDEPINSPSLRSRPIPKDQIGAYGYPRILRDLTDLTPIIYRKDASRIQKTEVLLSWLIQELNAPRQTATGLGGGPVTSAYVRVQLIKGLAVYGDTLALEWLTSSSQAAKSG